MNEKPLEDWKQIPIGDLGIFFGGLTGKTTKDFGEGSAFLTYMQVYLQKTSQKEAVDFVVIDGHEKQNKVVYGDILFTTSSETPDEIGMTDVFLESDWSPYLNSFCFGLRVRDNSLLYPPFTKYLLRGNKFREKIRPLAQGSTRFNLSKGNLAKISLLFPPLTEQKKIASILTSVDEVIEKTQKQIDKLQDLKKATMNELLTKGIGHTEFKASELGRIPKSWKTVSISDVCEEIFLGLTSKVDYVDSGGVYLVRATDISTGILDFSKTKRISQEQHQKLTKYRKAKKGDVLVSKSGSLGVCALVDTDTEFSIYESIIVMQSDKKILSSNFLLWFFRSSLTQHQMLGDSVGSTVGHLNLGDFRQLRMTLPPLDEQMEISKKISEINVNLNLKTIKLSQIQSLKKSLMQDLLTGKVRVQVN